MHKIINLLINNFKIIIIYTFIGIIIGYFLQSTITNNYKSYLLIKNNIVWFNFDTVLKEEIYEQNYINVPDGLSVIQTGSGRIATINHKERIIENKQEYYDYLIQLYVNRITSDLNFFKDIKDKVNINYPVNFQDMRNLGQINKISSMSDNELKVFLKENIYIDILKTENIALKRKFLLLFFTTLASQIISFIYIITKKK
jgi:hypothetical protein